MTVSRDSVVFAFDFSRIETIGGVRHLFDYSKNGFHFAFPGGAADPTPQLDGSLSFDGGDYLEVPAAQAARFYAALPTREFTFLAVFSCTAGSADSVLFSATRNVGGNDYGIVVRPRPTENRIRTYQFKGNAAVEQVYHQPVVTVYGARRVCALTVETTPRNVFNQSAVGSTATWGAGAFGTCVYDAAGDRWIGRGTGMALHTGRIWYLALLRGAVSSADLSELSRLLSEGVKPWCVR